jgi:DNA-binding transcriptional ArsR family regulator
MSFTLPKVPKIVKKDKQPDQRQIAVMPLKALSDKRLDNQAIRVFGLVCSYANRAGITWVSRQTIANILQVTPQAVSKQVAALKRLGYIEVVRKGFKGQRTETMRVVFNNDITLKDALANASSTEDLRSPQMKEEELKEMNESLLKKPIKTKKVIVKSNDKRKPAVVDNKRKDVEEMYVRWFKEKKVISNNDEIAIEMVQCSNVAWQQYIESLAVEFKMIASEGLRKPEDILAITKQILTGKGL